MFSGSYFAVNASYSHQYTDLRKPQTLRSSMTLYQPLQFNIPTMHGGVFLSGSSGSSLGGNPPTSQYSPINLSSNPFPAHTQSSGGQPGPLGLGNPGPHVCVHRGVSGPNLQVVPVQPGQPGPSSGVMFKPQQSATTAPQCFSCSKKKPHSYRILPKPQAIRQISGLASTALGTNMDSPQEPERCSAKMFFAKVLIGRYTEGSPKLRKPPARFADDPFGKCFDSCVDNMHSPKIFVIFDSAQAYPEYLIEYTYGS